MICLYYSPSAQCYDIAYEHDLIDQLRDGIVSVIETFDTSSQRIASRICKNLNLARHLS